MAERLVSPGVFTKENDLTYLPQGIAQIGAAFVGPTLKGPAFRPVVVESQEDFLATFGGTTPEFYTPFAVNQYLKEAARATVVRVLGLNGYSSATVHSHLLQISGSAGIATVGVIHPSRTGVTLASVTVSGSASAFTLTVSGSTGTKTYTDLSTDVTSPSYFVSVLGNSATTSQDGFVYAAFPSATAHITTGSLTATAVTGELNFSGSVYGSYSNAATPWIQSQEYAGGHLYPLFRLHTLSDGTSANTDIKVSVANIRPSAIVGEYGTFSLQIRKFTDTDSKLNVLEQFDNLTLDPTSANYVAHRIGTTRIVIAPNGDIYADGDFENNSRYVYLELADGSESAPVDALPYGFAPLSPPINSANVPAPAYVTTRYFTPTGNATSIANGKVYYGFDFNDVTSLAYLAPIPSGSAAKVGKLVNGSSDVGFNLKTSLDLGDASDLSPTTAASLNKFTVPFQGGFDGQNPAVVRATGANISGTNTQGFDLSTSLADGTRAYTIALATLANPESFDINLLVTPGVIYSQHPYVVTQGVTLCEDRGDCFYILDGDVLGATIDAAINAVEELDTNYAATYHPWVKVKEVSTNKNIWVPPSVVMPGVFAFNDRVSDEWYAPAGMQRGGIGEAIEVRSRVDAKMRNDLYAGRVNPIASFPGQGITVWGQKTLQHQSSAFDRINVRRLLIAVKKFIASYAKYLVFEQNVEATRNRFLSVVNPYLSNVAERNGLYAFKVVMDESNNTADVIDRENMVGALYLQPVRAAEQIILDFNVLPGGAVFPN